MDSLHPPCTPLKKKYDACFNHWFSEYLQLAAPSSTPSAQSHPSSENRELSSSDAQRQDKLRTKSEEYEKRCGDVWRAYRTCLEVRATRRAGRSSLGDRCPS